MSYATQGGEQMTQEINVRDKPAKKRDLRELYQAIEKMNDAERNFIAGAIAFAGSFARKIPPDDQDGA